MKKLRTTFLLLFCCVLHLYVIGNERVEKSDSSSGYEEQLASIFYMICDGSPESAQEEIDSLRVLLFRNGMASDTSLSNRELIQRVSNKVDWYQVLLYEKRKKYHKAKILLRHIRKSNSPYASKARKRLKSLRYRLIV